MFNLNIEWYRQNARYATVRMRGCMANLYRKYPNEPWVITQRFWF